MAQAETAANPWAAGVAEQVRGVLIQTPQKWLDPRDFAHVYRYSDDQAGHILRRAFEYGALERTKEGRRFVYRPTAAVAGPGHVVDVPVSASEPNPPEGRVQHMTVSAEGHQEATALSDASPPWHPSVLLDEVIEHGDENGSLANATGDELRDALALAADRLRVANGRPPRSAWLVGARRLVTEVWRLVTDGKVDSRSRAGDAALDMRDLIDSRWWPLDDPHGPE